MKLIVAGSRDFNDYQLLKIKVDKARSMYPIDTIISGTARGADSLGIKYAHEHGLKVERYPAEWKKYGKSAGYKRNVQMAEVADALLAFWDGNSRGTKHMINIARDKNLIVMVVNFD